MTEQVSASHILVSTVEEAYAVKNQLLEGQEFETIAKAVSRCPSGASAGGALGTFSRGQMVPEFEQATFALDIGEVSDPVQTPFGFHIIHRTG